MRWNYARLDINPVFPGLGESFSTIIIIIIIIIVIIIIIIIIIELTQTKTILENSFKIKPEPPPDTSKTFLNILAVSNKTAFWTCLISAVIPIYFNLLPNYLVIMPNKPTTNGIIFTLTFQNVCNSLLRSWYFSIFLLFSPQSYYLQELQNQWLYSPFLVN